MQILKVTESLIAAARHCHRTVHSTVVAFIMLSAGLLLLGAFALSFGVWQFDKPLPGPFISGGGYGWISTTPKPPLPLFFYLPSDGPRGNLSRLQLFENGKALGPAHTLHADIRALGQGRYSHWNGSIHFSTRTNHDPNLDPAHFRIRDFVRLRPVWVTLLALIASFLFLLRYVEVVFSKAGLPISFGSVLPERKYIIDQVELFCERRQTLALLGVVAAVFLISFVLAASLYAGESNPWLRMTCPPVWSPKSPENSLLCYSEFIGNHIIQLENIPTIQHVYMLSGGAVATDFYALRSMYSFFASVLSGVIGIFPAFFLINVLAWLGAIAAVGVIVSRITGDRRAVLLATALCSLGSGFWFHLHDYSAHLTSFALYYAGVLLIFWSDVWQDRRPLRTHIMIGAFIAAFALLYDTALFLFVVYAVVALGNRNKPTHVIAAGLGVTVARSGWPLLLNWVSGGTADYHATEQDYLASSISEWIHLLAQPAKFLQELASATLGFLSYDFLLLPVALIAIGMAWPRLRQNGRLLWLLFLAWLVPVAGGLVWAQSALARGYLSYGGSIAFYVLIAWSLSLVISRRTTRYVGFGLAAVALLLQIFWVLSPAFGNDVPLKIYFLGPAGTGVFRDIAAGFHVVAQNLSGTEPLPKLFGGNGHLIDAGLALPQSVQISFATGKSWVDEFSAALLLRTWLVVPLLVLCLAFASQRAYAAPVSSVAGGRCLLVIAVLFLILDLLPAAVNPVLLRKNFFLTSDFTNVPVPGAPHRIAYKIKLSTSTIHALQAYSANKYKLTALTGFGWNDVRPVHVEVFLDDSLVGSKSLSGRVAIPLNLSAFERELKKGTDQTNLLVVASSTRGMSSIAGWQVNSAANRKLYFDGKLADRQMARVLPILELRVTRANDGRVFAFVGY